jgi:hypothetical protein
MPHHETDFDERRTYLDPSASPDMNPRPSGGVVWADILADIAADERARNRSERPERDAA